MMLEKTLRWIVLTGVFFLPFVSLIVANTLFFPYITGKNFAFRIVVEIITGAYLALALVNPEYRPRRNWIFASLAVFLTVVAIADAQGAYPFKSFWSNFERMDGWITLAHLGAYTIVAASVLNAENLWKRLFQTSLAVSVFSAVYGFLQVAGFSALGQGGVAGLSARIDGRMGNPIYLAAYMLFHVFLAALLWSQSWKERRAEDRLAPSLLYGMAILFDTLALFLTGTRGTIVGLVGGVLLAAVLMVILLRNSPTVWRMAVAAVVGILLLVGGFWSIRSADWLNKIGVFNRLATISLSDSTVKARFLNMGIAWEGVKERPLLGWGQENYAVVFDKYYDPRMYGQEPWFDRVHNIIFDWLIAAGFLGLVSYLSLFAAALWMIWRREAFDAAEKAILTGLLAAYFCHNFFVFDNVTSYILFGSVLAYIVWRSARKAQLVPLGPLVPRSYAPYLALAAALLVMLVAWAVNTKALAANKTLLQALSAQQGGVVRNLELFESAMKYRSLGTQEAREQIAQGAAQVAQSSALTADIKQRFLDLATREMMLQEKESPLDARFPLFLGIVYDAFGDYASGAAALQRAHELSLKKQSIYYEMARNAQARGDHQAALSMLREAYSLDTSNVDARIYWAAASIRAGEGARAMDILGELVQGGQAADPRILSALVARKDYSRAIMVWNARLRVAPQDAQSYFTLAALHFETGNMQEAIKALEAAGQAIPAMKQQADALIAEIRSGNAKLQ